VGNWRRLEKHMLTLKAEIRPLQMYYVSGTEYNFHKRKRRFKDTFQLYSDEINLIYTSCLFHYSSVLSEIYDYPTLFHPRLCRSYTHNENRVHRSIPMYIFVCKEKLKHSVGCVYLFTSASKHTCVCVCVCVCSMSLLCRRSSHVLKQMVAVSWKMNHLCCNLIRCCNRAVGTRSEVRKGQRIGWKGVG
jgi:hypothetical protein